VRHDYWVRNVQGLFYQYCCSCGWRTDIGYIYGASVVGQMSDHIIDVTAVGERIGFRSEKPPFTEPRSNPKGCE